MNAMIERTKQHIGKAGELLVQYKLVKYGIDSSSMTTDSGIDLVAYSPRNLKAYTIQVKTQEKPTPGGGKGKLAISWYLKEHCPADLIAVIDLSSDSVWLFTYIEFVELAQQYSANGVYHLYMYVDESVKTKKAVALKRQFSKYLLEERVKTFF
ncbi:MAG: hypothetical protein A2464_11075 [Deltaproteobacteria bacterium RIFOXYC2_FULL_48_10]|nr:MAG: hypothetical protein A2464_11075 [Deltaproteobacteria bacterium RIFOXYC2_FULL_48_10]